jgi:putative two-component system response regulator
MENNKPTLLLVDDDSFILSIMVDILKPHYRLLVAKSGIEALDHVVAEPRPDLILLDVMMPDMDGFTVCETLNANPDTRDIPVIFVTGKQTMADEMHGLELGAVDYISKPISAPILQQRVRNHIILQQAKNSLAEQNVILEGLVQERTKELEITKDVTIHSMAVLSGLRDNETGNHILRTQHYVCEVAHELRRSTRYEAQLDNGTIALLFKSAPLHDLGKVGIPDNILRKPGKLTADEFEVMKTHTTLGYNALLNAEENLGHGGSTFLQTAREIAYTHHEKWDGSGYPRGLKEHDIPLSGQIMAVADVYDALIAKRIYKPAFSHEQALDVMREGQGSHFNPVIFDAFLRIEPIVLEIANSFQDKDNGH